MIAKTKKRKLSTTHIIIVLIAIYVSTIFIRQEVVIRGLKKKNLIADVELKDLKNEIKSLEKKIDQKNEGEYIERIAREEFDMIKSNEIIYRDKNKIASPGFSD